MPTTNWCLSGAKALCLSASDWAAWVQAIGSIVAIAIAIAIPLMLNRIERRALRQEKILRAKSFGLALLPGLEQLISNIKTANWRYREMEDEDDYKFVLRYLEIPDVLASHTTNLHELGDAGNLLQDALAQIPPLRTLINDHEFHDRYGGVFVEADGTAHDIPEPPSARPSFDIATRDLETALAAIHAMFRKTA